jgi:hypothetical protein
MQTFDVSTHKLDSQLSLFQKRTPTKTSTAADVQDAPPLAVPGDPVVKTLPCWRLKRHALLKLIVTQVVALVVLLVVLLSSLAWKWHKILAAVVLFMIPLLAVTKTEASGSLVLLLLLHDLFVLLLMI